MGKTAKERMREYRQRIRDNESRYAEYLEKERNRWKERKSKGKVQSINDLSDTGKRLQRRKWKKQKQDERNRNRQRNHLTPPPSPDQLRSTRKRGRKRIKAEKSAAYRTIKALKEELKKKSKLADKYRKRLEREKKRNLKIKFQDELIDKPRSLKDKLSKQSLLKSLVVKQIQNRMKLSKSVREKQIFSRIISQSVLKKYKLMHVAEELLGISYKRLRYNAGKESMHTYHRKKYKSHLNEEKRSLVKTFLEEDIHSRLLPGKRDTITRNGIKRQKRYLNDTMKNLHQEFVKTTKVKISYSMFCRLRPFWITEPKCTDRDTCTCKLHSNIELMLDKLKQCKVLNLSLKEACASLCCPEITKECMYRECTLCQKKTLCTLDFDGGQQVWIYQWKTKAEEREIQKADGTHKISVQIAVKEKENFTLETLLDATNTFLKQKICRHVYNITHQYKALTDLKHNIKPNEAVIHIDFSENYGCKMNTEIQSMHFGASRNQVSLHTGVLYKAHAEPVAFCSFSESTRHDPAAIWSHLHPVSADLKTNFPAVDTVHFISDGPTTQYRSKKNFFLLHLKCSKYNLKLVSWNFSESGHGKGAPDGVGGLLKRTADRIVAHGKDICNADDMFQMLNRECLSIKLYKIDDNDIFDNDKQLQDRSLKTIPGTMALHQVVITKDSSSVLTRHLSCFCTDNLNCMCFGSKVYSLKDNHDTSAEKNGSSEVENKTNFTPSVDIVGDWVVVKYDGLPYPGIVQDIDHDS